MDQQSIRYGTNQSTVRAHLEFQSRSVGRTARDEPTSNGHSFDPANSIDAHDDDDVTFDDDDGDEFRPVDANNTGGRSTLGSFRYRRLVKLISVCVCVCKSHDPFLS